MPLAAALFGSLKTQANVLNDLPTLAVLPIEPLCRQTCLYWRILR